VGGARRADAYPPGRVAPEVSAGRSPAPATLREIVSEREAGERREILEALRATRGNVNRAAERLRMARGTLRYRMQKYGIDERA
jgi:DNA-binding NtrC family response regulator